QRISETPLTCFQVARRLRALGAIEDGAGTPLYAIGAGTGIQHLIDAWRRFPHEHISEFWQDFLASEAGQGHFELVLSVLSRGHQPFLDAMQEAGIKSIERLVGQTNQEWKRLLAAPGVLPLFTAPGTIEERTRSFLRHLDNYFNITKVIELPKPTVTAGVPALERSADNPLDRLIAYYPGFHFEHWDDDELNTALAKIFPSNGQRQEEFTGWLTQIRSIIGLTQGIGRAGDSVDPLRFSVIEALWARGFLGPADFHDLSLTECTEALAGSVAYQYAEHIWNNGEAEGPLPQKPAGFIPVNPDGRLVNCIPPEHLSPFGLTAYLQDLLKVSAEGGTLGSLLAERRGPLGNLLASAANLSVPLPLIDLVNESLEYMVAVEAQAGIIYDTTEDQVGKHQLNLGDQDSFHDPATLLAVLPEHATPNTPRERQGAWQRIQQDFSSSHLPYHQPFDIVRTYLEQLGSTRYATMRRFRKEITEFTPTTPN
ncbi:MAG: hypothetical protein D3923_15625, partial [Candidatus Electrothrix sp. AR3]|nr:hypothetical protein [Candidatus Electrothrix sp. AR3]